MATRARKALLIKPPTTASTSPSDALLFTTAHAWQSWLQAHHAHSPGLWLKLSKKGASTPTLTYDAALDAALCFGWIDGQRRRLDAQHFVQRFTPRRRAGSLWSKRNVAKAEALMDRGLMRPAGLAEVEAARADGRWERAYAGSRSIEVPEDLREALEGNERAKAFFEGLNRTQRYPFLLGLETAKRPETRRRKIVQFVELLEAHKTC